MGLFDWLLGKKRSETGRAWKRGDRVLAKWYDSFFYPGRIEQASFNACQVFFYDGEIAWVHRAHIQASDSVAGSRVIARIRSGPAYFPATVSEQHGEKIHIRYDHGEEEWTSISLVLVQRTIAHVADEPPPPGAAPGAPAKQGIDL